MVEGEITKIVIDSSLYNDDSQNPKLKMVLCDTADYEPEDVDRRVSQVVITTEPFKGRNFVSYI